MSSDETKVQQTEDGQTVETNYDEGARALTNFPLACATAARRGRPCCERSGSARCRCTRARSYREL